MYYACTSIIDISCVWYLFICTDLNPILRQHKLSCLRVSSLAHVRASLLIGTSAGVILLLPLPAIGTTGTVTGSLAPLALMEGHAGPISFVATMATWKGNRPDMLDSACKSETETDMLVFSGGDGFEDFLSTAPSAAITDCSSCVNVWRCWNHSCEMIHLFYFVNATLSFKLIVTCKLIANLFHGINCIELNS